jgi:ornithine cyclodeaminase
VVDSREAYLEEAGELVLALDEGLLADNFIPDEIGQVVMGSEPGRTNDLEITLFKSVGNAVQDLAVATVVLEEARRLGLGTGVEL